MIRIYTIRGVLSMRNTRGCGTVSTCVNRHFSRHERFGRLGQESVRISIYNPKTPAYKRTIRRATTSDERKGRNYWRFHCSACRSAYKAKNQRSSFLPLTRKLRLGLANVRRRLEGRYGEEATMQVSAEGDCF